jgi:hypothetical protein
MKENLRSIKFFDAFDNFGYGQNVVFSFLLFNLKTFGEKSSIVL